MGLRDRIGRVLLRTLPWQISARLIDQRTINLDPATWDREYASGQWNFLDSVTEMPRYGVIAGYCRAISQTASILDIGCGTGLLREFLRQVQDRRYVGIDVSEAAIRQARLDSSANARFEVADASQFDPGEQFDAVVLNEMLYYIPQPELLLDRCSGFLRKDGRLVISMYESAQSLQTWQRCAPRLLVLDEIRLARPRGHQWRVRLCKPK